MEFLSLNIPTIIFWNPEHWEIHDRSKRCFKELEKVGIFHKTAESASLKVAEIWDNIPSWWNQKEIQSARKYFCDNFAIEFNYSVKELSNKISIENRNY